MAAQTDAPPQESQARTEHGLEQLKVANYYLRVALDQVPQGMLILDTQPLLATGPRIIFSNAPAACLMGADPAKGLRGLHLGDLTTSAADCERLLAALQQAAEGGSAECECDLQTFYGSGPKPCRWQVRAVFNNMRRLLNFTIMVAPVPAAADSQPATEAKKQEDLDAQCERLREKNMAALAQGIAHDVKNLLTPIAVTLSELIAELPPDAPAAEKLSIAFAGVRRAKEFTGQVVKAAKARPGECKPVSLKALIGDTVQISKSGTNVSVRIHVPSDLDWVLADPVKISQVLQNLVINGIQAMPGGGCMDVEAKNLTIAPGKDIILSPGRYVEIIVRDRGTGISPENLERLFHEVFSTKADGNGIGLTTCKRFIEEYHGDIRVSSKLNVGTEFRVILPAVLRPQNAPEPAGQSAPAGPIVLQHGEGTVLIVDDEAALRAAASGMLARCGYYVYDCDNGEQAIDIYRSLAREGRAPDVVLMDLTLNGGLSGTETLKEILRIDPTAKVVVTSGSVHEEVQLIFLEQGFVDVLPKPYDGPELTQTVYRVAHMRPAVTAAV